MNVFDADGNIMSINDLRRLVAHSMGLTGLFTFVCRDKFGNFKWKEQFKNIVTNEGLNDVLSAYFAAGSQSTLWYLGIFSTNSTPLATWNAAGIGSQFTEFTSYTSATRPAWTQAGASAQQITNAASPASFTMNGAGTLYGAFLINNNVKGGVTGKLYCSALFGNSRAVLGGDIITVTYQITVASN
jgi:hypothetical protein